MLVIGRFRFAWMIVVIAAGVGGCAEHLPTYSHVEPAAAMELMARRADLVHAFSAQGQVTLTKPSGESIVLDCAMAAKPPDFLRLRAWKFGQAAMDLTIKPDGTWAWTGQQDQDPAARDRMTRGLADNLWRLAILDGGFFRDPHWTIGDHNDHHFTALLPAEKNNHALRLEVDADTLLVRRITVLTDKGAAGGSIKLDDYRGGDIIPWAARVSAAADSGSMVLRIREMEFNTELPEQAFTPPARAQRLR